MNSLCLPTDKMSILAKEAFPRRKQMIEEAINFPSNPSTSEKIKTTLYRFQEYEVGVLKPGKEFFSTRIKNKKTGQLGNNKNDMTPTIFKNGTIYEKKGTFEEIFKQFLFLMDSPTSLQQLGALCVRNAFTLDHKPDEKGNLRYSPPNNILNEIKNYIPSDFPEPLEVFLFYLEVIALNEDVKYYTLEYDINTGTGRRNTLLTFANVINLILKKNEVSIIEFLAEVMEFTGQLARNRGVNAISSLKAIEAFPHLTPLR